MVRRLLAILGAAVGLAGGVLQAADASRPPNIVLIVADDMRPDAPSFVGNRVIATPNIDALALRGAVFPRATCSSPICHVSRSEMFSGRPLVGSDVERGAGGAVKFNPAWTLWPQHMKRAGWHTVYSGKWHVGSSPWSNGFVETAGLFSGGGGPAGSAATLSKTPTGRAVTGYRGWTFKNDKNQPLPELGVGLTRETDRVITDRAVEAMRRCADRPFFIQISYTAPHDPLHWPEGRENQLDYRKMPLPPNFLPAPEFDTGNISGRDEQVVPAPRTAEDVQRERAIYFSQVENVDRQIGRVVRALEELGQLQNTVIIVTSDHGLALGSHGLMGKQNQYEHTINVTLVMAGPTIPTGKSFAAQCYLRDLYPTVSELAGLPIPSSVEGRSLVPVLRGRQAEVHDAIFGYFTDVQRMIRDPDGWKLISYPKTGRHQLFNVAADPHELRDRVAEPEQQARLARMKSQLRSWQLTHKDPAVRSSE